MPTRRDVLGAGGLALASVALGGCDSSVDDYESVAAGIWRHASAVPDTLSGLLAELVRQGVAVTSYADKEPTLEDDFMVVTKGVVS